MSGDQKPFITLPGNEEALARSDQEQRAVFICYPREDRDMVLRLAAGLRAPEVTVRGDWDLEAAVQYEDVLGEWIEEAGLFVLIMTPESLASPACQKEIDLALRFRKKLAAVQRRLVDLEAVPPEFRPINWVILSDEADLEQAARLLRAALDKDRDWEQAHTKLLRRAMDWNRGGRRRSAALRSEDLQEAEQWLVRAGAEPTRVPRPAEDQLDFIQFSRQVERRRLRTVAGSIIGALIVVAVLLGISVIASQREAESAKREKASAERAAASDRTARIEAENALTAKRREDEARRMAESQKAETLRQQAVAKINGQNAAREILRGIEERGRQLLVAGDPEGSLPFLARTLAERPTVPGLGDDSGLRFMIARAAAPLDGRIATLWPQGLRVLDVALRPDEKQVMTRTQDGAVRLWNATNGWSKSILAAQGAIDAVYSPDGTRLVTLEGELGTSDGETPASYEMRGSLVDASNGSILATYNLGSASDPGNFPTPQLDPKRGLFFLAENEGTTEAGYKLADSSRVEDVSAPPLLRSPEETPPPCGFQNIVGRSADGATLITDQGQIFLAAGCRWIGALEGPLPVHRAVFSRDGSVILTAQRDVAILWRRHRLRAGLLAAMNDKGSDAVFTSPSSLQALIALPGGVELYDLEKSEGAGTLSFGNPKSTGELIPLTTRAVVQQEERLELWDVTARRPLAKFELDEDDLSKNESEFTETQWVADAGSGSLLIKYPGQWDVTWSTIFEVWDLHRSRRISRFQVLGANFDVFTISRDSGLVFASASEGVNPSTWVTDRRDWNPFYLSDSAEHLRAAAFSRDNQKVVAVGGDRAVRVWNLNSGKITARIPGRLEGATSLSISSRDRYLLASSSRQSEIFDLQREISVALLEGAAGDDWAFSPDERFAVTAGPDEAVRVYETATGRLLWSEHLPGAPRTARWHPKGKMILVQAGGSTLLLNAALEGRNAAEIAALVQSHCEIQSDHFSSGQSANLPGRARTGGGRRSRK